MSLRLLFKYTTRSRRSNFLRGIDSIIDNLADKENYHIYTTFDVDDDKMRPLPEIKGNHTYIAGTSKSKVDAINRDMDFINANYDWDILVNMSDDVVITEKGFDNIIRYYFNSLVRSESMSGFENTPFIEFVSNEVVNLDQVIHFPDGNRDDLLTVSIIGKDYYKRDNYIYNPEYKSLYCDNEAMEVAKQRGCYKFVNKVIFNHLHPAYNKGNFDAQYLHTESFGHEDYQTYKRRKANGFS
jgi:hypothetical protein